MEKKFSKEVTIVLLPPLLLNKFELNSKKVIFLDLGDIINFEYLSLRADEIAEETPSVLASRIAKADFGREIIDLVNSRDEEQKITKIILLNYPMNKSQLENLEKAFISVGFVISKLIVASLTSFDILTTAKNEGFICPICFKSYAKKDFLKQDKYACPLDKKNFSVSYISRFTEYLITYYLQNSIEVIQSFTRDEKKEERKVLNLNIESGNVTENVRKSLLDLVEEE